MNEEPRKWRVTMSRWDVVVIDDIWAATREQAEDLAVEQFESAFDFEREDGGINSLEVEEMILEP